MLPLTQNIRRAQSHWPVTRVGALRWWNMDSVNWVGFMMAECLTCPIQVGS